MKSLSDYETPAASIDDTPRPNASQAVAAQKRARPTHNDPEPITNSLRRQTIAAGALLAILVFVGAASWQLARLPSARPLAITPAATVAAPTAAGSDAAVYAAPTRTPVLAPTPLSVPSVAPEPSGDVLGAPQETLPQTGQGLTVGSVDEAAPTPEPPPAEQPSKGTKEAPDRAAHHATAVAQKWP